MQRKHRRDERDAFSSPQRRLGASRNGGADVGACCAIDAVIGSVFFAYGDRESQFNSDAFNERSTGGSVDSVGAHDSASCGSGRIDGWQSPGRDIPAAMGRPSHS
ncbi:MAG: hypothetical protein QF368_02940 [SAR202 cluster bacterium]|nr:hypothetical protein [SAR202 cluster bacterium]